MLRRGTAPERAQKSATASCQPTAVDGSHPSCEAAEMTEARYAPAE